MSKRIVQCSFSGTTLSYAYYTDLDNLVVGDFAVVVSPYPSNAGDSNHNIGKPYGFPVVVRVEAVNDAAEAVEKTVTRIVQKIDLDDYLARMTKAEERNVLLAKIKRAEAEARELLEIEKLTALSPELKSLVEQLKLLG